MADHWQDSSLSNLHIRDDNDDDVPDAWEDELEEKPKKSDVEEKPKAPVKAPPTTKNKQIKKKYGGDEPTSDEEFLESLKEPDRQYTAEELDELRKRAEIQKEEVKLKMATDFIGTSGERHSLDNTNLITKDEFLDYSFRLYNRLDLLSKSEFYKEFLDDLLTGLTKPISLDSVKHIQATLHAILLRKQNEEREKKQKPKAKKPVKPQLTADRRSEIDSFVGEGITSLDKDEDYDEDNDFM
ncbi:unnamed protein product [Rotaria sp. Silwood1]|nr:unnamed protein product [Rotaria sp. Silwood1]CAF0751545.1 unnamed protein product [Rotaria sp. Silwood1]CAF3358269.1 unnamed protein product [Rotaria sp. Silwood1]CAF3362379.1 unnamed protein product [Rotaria sp. Silwood1]CAF4503591.1 unnamed protein product [Rotaria sp. Silwood1]